MVFEVSFHGGGNASLIEACRSVCSGIFMFPPHVGMDNNPMHSQNAPIILSFNTITMRVRKKRLVRGTIIFFNLMPRPCLVMRLSAV